ncbi:MAG: DUF4157 domain-containing protein [Trueperaceae bacterium]
MSDPGDRYEQEADRVAHDVTGTPVHVAPPQLQRFSGQPDKQINAPLSVAQVLASPGRELEPTLRQSMERRLGHDFSKVRVHTDTTAEQSAQDVNAQAYTVGHNVVFGAGQFVPETHRGQFLLAHELAHVVQQSTTVHTPHAINHPKKVNNVENGLVGKGESSSLLTQPGFRLQRKVSVDKPKNLIANPTGKGLKQSNAETVESYLQTLCSGGAVAVDKGNGNISLAVDFCPTPLPPGFSGPPAPAPADMSKEPTGCGCLCDMVGSTKDYIIVVDDKDWPHTLGQVVTTPSPNSSKLWGTATVSGKAATIDPWLVLGHELCGHAWLAEKGLPDDNVTRGEGGHQETVSRENQLRQEHGIEERGGFKDPYCGESFWKDKAKPGKINWSSYLSKCMAWRKKAYGGKYKISDQIP